MKQLISISLFIFFFCSPGKSQSFAPASGFEGTTAIYKDSTIFIDWATETKITRGYQDIAFPENGYVDYGTVGNATGKADGNPNVVSLGDGGSAILKFNFPIVNGDDYDFAVFENGFFENDTSELAFLELAFVEVSTDGIEFVRFPAISEIQTYTQTGSFEKINARYIHNLAGKYTMFYGTPFNLDDIEDLTDGTSVNTNEINYIKIIDVIGSISDNLASHDSKGNIINDPYPTAFASGGFDLDAVGVINNQSNIKFTEDIVIVPNPVRDFLNFRSNISKINKVEVFSVTGKLIISTDKNNNIDVRKLRKGVYILKVSRNEKCSSAVFFK
ncbi:MAG: T9SS type A sorting domain-containing protein [Bacteroidales bacterium]|nr:T9SS type A sorting domain-containing protein [Bacteroidales bacterium]